jgi:predicted nucleotidyltransferase
VFGSVARSDAGPDSDVDFLVEMEDDRSFLDLVGPGQDLEELLHCKVDVLTDATARESSLKHGRCEGRNPARL